jgi:hypothetical protein
MARTPDDANAILDGSTGILRSSGTFGGKRKVVFKVIVDGRQAAMMSTRFRAWIVLREYLGDERRAAKGKAA